MHRNKPGKIGIMRRAILRRRIRILLSTEQQLAEAVWNGKTKHLSRLISAEADVNAADANGVTPLARAAWSGQTEALQLLLQAGAAAGINHRDKEEGITALHAAVIVCREIENYPPDNVFLLLSAGADPNIPDRDGWTPLHSCAFYRLPQLIPALLAAGADRNRQDNQGNTPADIARSKRYPDIHDLFSEAQRIGLTPPDDVSK